MNKVKSSSYTPITWRVGDVIAKKRFKCLFTSKWGGKGGGVVKQKLVMAKTALETRVLVIASVVTMPLDAIANIFLGLGKLALYPFRKCHVRLFQSEKYSGKVIGQHFLNSLIAVVGTVALPILGLIDPSLVPTTPEMKTKEEPVYEPINGHSFNKHFGGILCINLPKSLKRRYDFVKTMKDFGSPQFEWLPATWGADCDPNIVKKMRGKNGWNGSDKLKVKQARTGCWYSHRRAIQLAKERGWKNTLILEDDMIPAGNVDELKKFVDDTMKKLPEDWDILYLTTNVKECDYTDIEAGDPHWVALNDWLTAKGRTYLYAHPSYVINEKAYDKILSILNKIEDPKVEQVWPVDDQIIEDIHPQEKCYVLKKKIFCEPQENHGSTITVDKEPLKIFQNFFKHLKSI
ncbi:MAG: hypothetical protein K940chlam3_01435 [Chlamydiae bacterium]|nr:hypothetical protein [Chlamydiota bacterium]